MDEQNNDRFWNGNTESGQAQGESGGAGQAQGGQNTAQQGPNGCFGRTVIAYPQDVVLASTSLALALTKGRSQYEIETLINLFSLTTNNLQSILAQILINKKTQDILETPL